MESVYGLLPCRTSTKEQGVNTDPRMGKKKSWLRRSRGKGSATRGEKCPGGCVSLKDEQSLRIVQKNQNPRDGLQ